MKRSRIIEMLFCVFVVLCAVPCFAQDEEASSGMQIFAYIWELLAVALVPGIAWVFAKLGTWLKSKIKNETLANMMARFTEAIGNLVMEAEQTSVAAIKAAKDLNSPGGTKLTKEEAKQIKNEVLQKFKDLWGPKGLDILAKILGFDSEGVEDFISSKIEALVSKEKKSGNPSHP